jgi:Zn/Cd-binding protein ZinT
MGKCVAEIFTFVLVQGYKYSVMIKIKKIAIVSTNSFGYINFLVQKLEAIESVDLTFINIDAVPFKYKNKWSRIENFFSKILFNKSLKEINRTTFIKKTIAEKNPFDQILVIRPDLLELEALEFLRANGAEMSCYLFDGIENFKYQKSILGHFDTVFSYDKSDVAKYGFEFITNYIYDDVIENSNTEFSVFTICSYDKRFQFLEKIANQLSKMDVSFRFIVKKDKVLQHQLIQFSPHYISLEKVKELISKSDVLVDIQKKNQIGLSFRVFEALGFKKKLITNNADIVNYDFYNENNIFVISEDNLEIPKSFFESEYSDVPAEILSQYKLKNWISQVFKV